MSWAELDFPPDTLPHEAACNRHLQAQLAANSCARENLLASDYPGQKTTINNQHHKGLLTECPKGFSGLLCQDN